MRFDPGGKGFLTGDGVPPLEASSLLQRRLVPVESLLCWALPSGAQEAWSPMATRAIYGPLQPLPGGRPWSYKAYTMACQVAGLKVWWVLGVFAEVVFGGSRQEEVAQVMKGGLTRWLGWTDHYLASPWSLRRGIDRRGRDTRWHRIHLEATASATGMLAWLVCCSACAREGVPELCYQVLDSLPHHFRGHVFL